MKIKVYQQGGGLIYTPFIPEAGAARAASASVTTNSGESKIDPLDKEILELMKDANLLPSDISMIYNKLVSFQRQASRLSSLGGPNPYGSAMPGMLQIQHMVSLAKNNKENWDVSIKTIKEHEAGSEIALDSYGRMWVRNHDDNGLELIDPSQFDQNKHTPVSYSQLMFFRRSEPEMAFSTMPFEELGEHVVGMKDARAAIQATIDKFGKIKTATIAAQEIKNLADKVSENGYFNITEEKTRSIASPETLNNFTQLIWDNLDSNIQHLLIARGAVSKKNPLEIIRNWVFANSDYIQSKNFDASLTKAADGVGAAAEKTGTLKPDTYQIRFANGEGNVTRISLVPTASEIGDRGGLMVEGLDFGPMLNFKQLPLGIMNLQQMLFTGGESASALATSVRSTDVTFGNKLLNEAELPTVMYNNRSLTSKVYLPYRNENGHFTPNFKVIDNFNKYLKARQRNRNMSTTEKNALLAQCNLRSDDIVENSDGTISLKNTMPFLCFSAVAGDDTLKLTADEKRYLSKIDKSRGRTIADMYNNAIKFDNVYAKKDASIIRKKYEKSEANDFWEGNVFIPVPDSFYAYNSTSNQYVPMQEFNDVPARIWTNNIENELRMEAQANPNYNDYSKIGQF